MDKKQQRRLQNFSQLRPQSMHLTGGPAQGAIQIKYGHDGVRTFIVFNHVTEHVAMEDYQVEEMIKALRDTNDKLKAYRADGGQPITQGTERPNG